MNKKHQNAINKIISTELRGDVLKLKNITDGNVGHVYKVKVFTEGKEGVFVIKLIDNKRYKDKEETADERIYGVDARNFKAAYDLIKSQLLTVPKLYCFDSPTEEIPYGYQVTSFLEGVSIRTFLEHGNREETDKLHNLTARKFAEIHQITRPYYGWVNQSAPYPEDWGVTFFEALRTHLTQLCKTDPIIKESESEIGDFIECGEEMWTGPEEFVLSNKDGFQGMAKSKNGRWKFTGFIDFEDHKFLDQRFVLAGYELPLDYAGRGTPESFWKNYKRIKKIDTSYESLRTLFKLYFPLRWLRGIYDHFEGQEEEKQRAVKRHRELILRFSTK